jgi:hypothetical protein
MSFVWNAHACGYHWTDSSQGRALVALPSDQPALAYAPLEEHSGLFLTFAATDTTEAGTLAFANRYGLLGLRTMQLWDILHFELFPIWASQIQAMKTAVTDWMRVRQSAATAKERKELYTQVNEHLHLSAISHFLAGSLLESSSRPSPVSPSIPVPEAIANLRSKLGPPPILELLGDARNIQISFDESGRVILDVMPRNLLNALWYQFALAVVQNTEFRQCPSCSSWFAVSPDRRRADAQYCKEACRVRAYKNRRKEARRLHGAGKTLREIARELSTTVKAVKGWVTESKA